MQCDADGSRRLVPPAGLRERRGPAVDRTFASTARYRNAEGTFLFLRAEPALVELELLAAPGAQLIRRDGTRYVVSQGGPGDNPAATARWLLGDASITMIVFADLDPAAVVDLAAHVHAIDEATFHADPPTTTRSRVGGGVGLLVVDRAEPEAGERVGQPVGPIREHCIDAHVEQGHQHALELRVPRERRSD